MNLSATLKRLITSLFCFLVSVLPFVFFWVNDELFEFNKMTFVYGFTAIIVSLHCVRMILEKRLIWQKTIFDWPVGIFLLSQALSTILSWHPRTSFLGYYTRLNGGLLSIICYSLLYFVFVANVAKKYWSQFLTFLFGASILVSLYAIGEHNGHSLSCLIIKGNFNVSCWVQKVQERVFATFGQPNWLAAYNVTLIGLGTMLLLPTKKNWLAPMQRAIIGVATCLNLVTLIYTKSRSGIIAFGAGLVVSVILVLAYWWRQQYLNKKNLQALGLILGGVAIILAVLGTQYTPSLEELINAPAKAQVSTSETASAPTASAGAMLFIPIPLGVPEHLKNIDFKITDSAEIRKIVWRGALDIWRTHPFFGTGVETFAYSYYAYRPQDHNWVSEWDFLYNKAHNELLNIAANSGTFGLLAYLSAFVILAICVLKAVWQKNRRQSEQTYVLIGVAAGLLALSITNFFGFSTVMVQVLLYLYLAIAALLYQNEEVPLAQKGQLNLPWQKVGVVVVIVAGVVAIYQTSLTWIADYHYAQCKALLARSGGVAQALAACEKAISLRPREAVYQIELGDYYAQYASQLARTNPNEPQITTLASLARRYSDSGFALNNNNLNFYKTRFRTLTNLAIIQPGLINEAQQILEEAIARAPTDPKLAFYYSTILSARGDTQTGAEWLDKALALRPLYLDARLAKAARAWQTQDYPTALANYQFILDHIDAGNTTAQTVMASVSAQLSPP